MDCTFSCMKNVQKHFLHDWIICKNNPLFYSAILGSKSFNNKNVNISYHCHWGSYGDMTMSQCYPLGVQIWSLWSINTKKAQIFDFVDKLAFYCLKIKFAYFFPLFLYVQVSWHLLHITSYSCTTVLCWLQNILKTDTCAAELWRKIRDKNWATQISPRFEQEVKLLVQMQSKFLGLIGQWHYQDFQAKFLVWAPKQVLIEYQRKRRRSNVGYCLIQDFSFCLRRWTDNFWLGRKRTK